MSAAALALRVGPSTRWGSYLMSRLDLRQRARTSPEGADDAALIQQTIAGERRAFDRLHERYVDEVWRRLTRLVGPDPEREDLTQQVFLEIFRGLARFRGDATFRTYLHRVVVYIACDYLGRRRRRPVQMDAEFIDGFGSSDASPEARAEQRERLTLIWEGLERVKPKKRVAFLLRVVEGLSLEEIGELVGARVTTVAKRVKHAEEELGRFLQRRAQRGVS